MEQEAPYPAGILRWVLVIGKGMRDTFRKPDVLGAGMGVMQRTHHPRGYEGVGIAVNEEHGTAAFGYLLQGTGLGETPAVQHLAEKRGGVKNGERRQGALGLQFARELVPCTGVAAIFHEMSDTGGQTVLCGKHHGGGGTHGYAMHHDGGMKQAVGNTAPAQDIQAVKPPHTDRLPVALSMGMEVGQQDVASQVVMVHIAQMHHVYGTITVAVHQYCRSRRSTPRQIIGMQATAVLTEDESIPKDSVSAYGIHPPCSPWVIMLHPLPCLFLRPCRVSACQGKVQHIERCAEHCNAEHNGKQEDISPESAHSIRSLQRRVPCTWPLG